LCKIAIVCAIGSGELEDGSLELTALCFVNRLSGSDLASMPSIYGRPGYMFKRTVEELPHFRNAVLLTVDSAIFLFVWFLLAF